MIFFIIIIIINFLTLFNRWNSEWDLPLSFSEDAYLSWLPVAIIKAWYQREGYIKSMADLIAKELESFSNPSEVGLSILIDGFESFCKIEHLFSSNCLVFLSSRIKHILDYFLMKF